MSDQMGYLLVVGVRCGVKVNGFCRQWLVVSNELCCPVDCVFSVWFCSAYRCSPVDGDA